MAGESRAVPVRCLPYCPFRVCGSFVLAYLGESGVGLSIVFFNVNLLYICLGETDPDCPSTETNVFVIGHGADVHRDTRPVERGVTDR